MNTKIYQLASTSLILFGCASTAVAAPAAPSTNPCANITAQQQTRCYQAHGFFWNGIAFVYEYRGQQPLFADQNSNAAVIAESGITYQNDGKDWTQKEMNIITTAVLKIAVKVGGIEGGAHLKQLLGNATITFARRSHSEQYPGATAEKYQRTIWFHDETFAADRTTVEIYGTVAHELAHIIGDINTTSDGKLLKEAFPYLPNGLGLVAPKTYEAGNPEYFAEGVKLWVFENYPTKWHLDAQLQGQWLADALKG